MDRTVALARRSCATVVAAFTTIPFAVQRPQRRGLGVLARLPVRDCKVAGGAEGRRVARPAHAPARFQHLQLQRLGLGKPALAAVRGQGCRRTFSSMMIFKK